MINLTIYPGKPILVNRKHLLELITDPTDLLMGLRYRDKNHYLYKNNSIFIEPDIKVEFHNVYKDIGISLTFTVPPHVLLQRSLGKDPKSNRHIWYTRKKVIRRV